VIRESTSGDETSTSTSGTVRNEERREKKNDIASERDERDWSGVERGTITMEKEKNKRCRSYATTHVYVSRIKNSNAYKPKSLNYKKS
jgi:hypothetical protein